MENEILVRKAVFAEGSRVEVIEFINDPYRPLEVGTQGTVLRVDDIGTVHVKWDAGFTLGAVLEDEITII